MVSAQLALLALLAQSSSQAPLRAVPFQEVALADRWWRPRIEVNLSATIPANYAQCESTGRLANFAVCAKLQPGQHRGALYNDSDVYKLIEGVAYTLSVSPSPELEQRTDTLISWIALAQAPDGYLNTYWTLVEPGKRYTNLAHGHELYCAGHLIEAGIAYAQATGKTRLLEVARRFADAIAQEFGPEGRLDPPGHQELELALYKLAARTGEERYADLAEFFLRERGDPRRAQRYGPYAQDELPVLEQREVTGHAVRAMYQYAAMADAAARPGADPAWRRTLEALWEDVVLRKMYVTGGIGNSAHNEGFTEAHDLPNESAYCETCASVGMVLWNHRMLLLTQDPRYAEILELELYNNLSAGVSLSGERFFYVNPLLSDGGHHRVPWFDCSCCPTNVVRTVPSVGDRVWAHDERSIWALLYLPSATTLAIGGQRVKVRQESDYPYDGRILFTLEPEQERTLRLMLRMPGWCQEEAQLVLRRGGEVLEERTLEPAEPWGEWHALERRWRSGDQVELRLPMRPRRVYAAPEVTADVGRVALARGPLVYALEGVDNDQSVSDLVLPRDGELWSGRSTDPALAGVPIVRANGFRRRQAGGSSVLEATVLTAVPYALWDNRAAGPMAVWLAEDPALAQESRPFVHARAADRELRGSHCWRTDALAALCDGLVPAASNDHTIPRQTFWDHRGGSEWLEYRFPSARRFAESAVYWFDDTGVGSCRLPRAWRLLAEVDGEWRPVELVDGDYACSADRFCGVRFQPVETRALRMELELQDGYSAGVLEWQVRDAP